HARPTIGGPKFQQNNFAFELCQVHFASIQRRESDLHWFADFVGPRSVEQMARERFHRFRSPFSVHHSRRQLLLLFGVLAPLREAETELIHSSAVRELL